MFDNSKDQPTNQDELGRTIRTLRESRNLSVRTLATRAGFSASFISQIENGQASPSIASMEKIAHSLGVSLSEFFAQNTLRGEEPIVNRADEGYEIKSEWSAATIKALGQVWQGQLLSPLLLSIAPGGRSGSSTASRQRELFAYVVDGQLIVQLENESLELEAGDSLHLPSGQELCWKNQGEHRARVLLITYPR